MYWEDAIADGLVRVENGHVHLTAAGRAAIRLRQSRNLIAD